MGIFFVFILKSSICLTAFYLFYKLLLSKETFHSFNRLALLGIFILSFLIPLCKFALEKPLEMHSIIADASQVFGSGYSNPVIEEKVQLSLWTNFILPIYMIGIIFFLVRNIYSLVRIIALLRNSVRRKYNDVTLIIYDKKIASFSWFNYIVISSQDMFEGSNEIIAHEMAHVRKLHSLDLLIAEITILFQWFNPAAWLMKQELHNVHEYQADETVINQGIDTKQYQLLLIKKAVGAVRFNSLANSFNHSKLKKRITMMVSKKSNPWARLKYLYVLPVAAIAVTTFAQSEVSNKLNEISEVKVSELSLFSKQNQEDKVRQTIINDNVETGHQVVEYENLQNADSVVVDSKLIIKSKASSGRNLNEGIVIREFSRKEIVTEEEVIDKKDMLLNNNNETIVISPANDVELNAERLKLWLDDQAGDDALLIIDDKESTINDLNSFPQSKIKSIRLLKNKTAISIYGDRGKKGVMEVITK